MSPSEDSIQQPNGSSTSAKTRTSRTGRGGRAAGSGQRRGGGGGGGYPRNEEVASLAPPPGLARRSGIEQDEVVPEGEQCVICAERIEYAALTPCNHTTCHKCTFRQRALYEKNNCLICRSENERVVMTELLDKEYDEVKQSGVVNCSDETFNIDFTQEYVKRDTLRLLANECSICNETLAAFKDLTEHARDAHGKYYCLICSRFKKAFKIELKLYNYKNLQKHQSQGDESGFGGHPECRHCRGKRFYSEDELNVHIRERHERCHICDQTTPKTADYYRNYEELYRHFAQHHYVCTVASCVEKKFVVFGDDLDLTAHMLKEHGGLSNNGNRVVIGSNSHHTHQYHHHNSSSAPRQFGQLSTFNNARWLSSNSDQEEDQQSPEIKKRRFEERAKHYLNYDHNKYNEFVKLNETFKRKRINAEELLQIYKQNLFIHQTIEELNLLVKEFLEFFPEGSDLQKDLLSILVQENEETPTEQFPILGGRSAANAFSTGGWLNGNRSASPVDNFPPLKKPVKVNYINPNEQPIRYTTVVKKTPQPKKKPAVTMASPYLPNYLDNTRSKSNPSINETPRLGQSGSSSSSASASSSKLSSMSNQGIDDGKFPALQKKSTKKVIPRVNEVKVMDPKNWGQPQAEFLVGSSNGNDSDDGGLEIFDKRKQKLKKKQDRLLFSNAF
ncbi:uncharacterized protein LODBEIA_P42660 [Lodderomyces beijingensis]|uniref:RING-type E3 ubiquitin transferase n=1 Tax=Lodderomyces beijingensis TaxID=1775926 RepID=A0ABP0ZRR4_9ASCO